MTELRPIEQRIFDLLSDGGIHNKAALHLAMYPGDPNGINYSNIKTHISLTRKKIQRKGLDIRYVIGGGREGYLMYRMISKEG